MTVHDARTQKIFAEWGFESDGYDPDPSAWKPTPTRFGITQKMRFDVLTRDGFACRYCGADSGTSRLHVDHIEPVCQSGPTDVFNLITSCTPCNLGKGGRQVLPPPSQPAWGGWTENLPEHLREVWDARERRIAQLYEYQCLVIEQVPGGLMSEYNDFLYLAMRSKSPVEIEGAIFAMRDWVKSKHYAPSFRSKIAHFKALLAPPARKRKRRKL